MSVSVSNIESILKKLNISYTVNRSNSMSDRHGPSLSAYFKTKFGTIRLSDHFNITNADLEISVSGDPIKAEFKIRKFVNAPIDKSVQGYVDNLDRERKKKIDDIIAQEKTKKQGRIQDMLVAAGLDKTIGAERRRAIAYLHNKRMAKQLLGDRYKDFY